jgi:hypothetical protein
MANPPADHTLVGVAAYAAMVDPLSKLGRPQIATRAKDVADLARQLNALPSAPF